MTEIKKPRKTHSGAIKDKERTMGKLLNSVGVVLRAKGYTGLSTANIAREAGVDRKLISLYFGSVDNLIETYIKRKDYWIETTAGSLSYFGNEPSDGSRAFLEDLLLKQIDQFANNVEMQKVVLWQVSEKSEIMSQVSREREKMSNLFFSLSDKELQNKDIDLRAITSLLVAGIYYLVLHEKSTDSTFCEIDLSSEAGMDRIRAAIKQILKWTYESK